MKYHIYFTTRSYKENLETVELKAVTELGAAQEYLEGYKANAILPDEILEQIEDGEAWIEAEEVKE